MSAARTAAAAVFVAQGAGAEATCVVTAGTSRLNGEAGPLVREALRTREARFFGPAQLPLFESPVETVAGACLPFESAGGDGLRVLLLERGRGEPGFSEAEQKTLLAFAIAAGFHAPPAPAEPLASRPGSAAPERHDPESRRRRHGLRHLHAKMVGESPGLIDALRRLEDAVDSPQHVLLLGETGTGKEDMARELVEVGHSEGWTFVKVSPKDLSPTLLESELFGYMKGAFTGALKNKPGLIVAGQKIVLFIDEVAEVPPDIQVKLFHLVDTGEFRPVGSQTLRKARVRIVAATSGDLERRMAEGTFKIDFYYRLAEIVVRLPALRDRPDDALLLLAWFFPEDFRRFGADALDAIASYAWPGNVREFRNVLRVVIRRNPGTIGAAEIRSELAYRPGIPPPSDFAATGSVALLKRLPDSQKRRVIEAALARNGNDPGGVRREAGYSDTGWVKLLVRLGMRPPKLQ